MDLSSKHHNKSSIVKHVLNVFKSKKMRFDNLFNFESDCTLYTSTLNFTTWLVAALRVETKQIRELCGDGWVDIAVIP